jgi:predicted nucleotidyltransferase
MAQNDLTNILDKYIKKVVPFLSPQEIILYGSQARGTARKDSDIDIAVIVDSFDDSNKNYLKVETELNMMCLDVDLRIEPILLESNIDRSGFLTHIRHTGQVIYSRAA